MSCAAIGYDYRIRPGDSGTVENEGGIVLVYKAGTPPAPVDLTGSRIVFEVQELSGPGFFLRRDSDAGGVIVSPLSGAVSVPFSSDDTQRMVAEIRRRGIGLHYRVVREIGAARRTLIWGLIREAENNGGC
jgi:hypothetical protein